MGEELQSYVEQKYDQVVVHKDDFYDIKADIEKKMQELQEKYKRCKPFRITYSEFEDQYRVACPHITVKPDTDTDKVGGSLAGFALCKKRNIGIWEALRMNGRQLELFGMSADEMTFASETWGILNFFVASSNKKKDTCLKCLLYDNTHGSCTQPPLRARCADYERTDRRNGYFAIHQMPGR